MSPDFIIVGAGMAGAALAAQLSAVGQVVVLEQGAKPAGEGASQNAGLIRRLDPEPCDRALAQRTHLFLTEVAPELGLTNLSESPGAVLGLVRDPLWLHNARAHLDAHGIAIHSIDPADFPVFAGSPVQHAWHLPDERVCSGPALAASLLGLARARGADIRCNAIAHRIRVHAGRVTGLDTSMGPINGPRVVLAGGAWTQALAETAGVHRTLHPLRRTAGLVAGAHPPSPNDPWVWLDDVGVYAKPEGKHWMVSPCNESPEPAPTGPGSTGTPTDSEWSLTQQKLDRFLPSIGSASPVRTWTGLRTFAPDRRPLVGEDNALEGLWWAAGLGGSGVSSCWGVAEAITAWIQGQRVPWLDPETVAPGRPQLKQWPIYPTGDPGRARLIAG